MGIPINCCWLQLQPPGFVGTFPPLATWALKVFKFYFENFCNCKFKAGFLETSYFYLWEKIFWEGFVQLSWNFQVNFVLGNPKTLTAGPQTPTMDWICGLRYRLVCGLPLWTDFTYGLSNRLLVSVKLSVTLCKCNRLGFLTPPEKCLKAVFSVRRCWWQKEDSICLWKIMEDYGRLFFRLFKLVCICNSAEQIVKPGRSSRTHGKMGWTKCRGERAQISRFPRGFPEASWRLSSLS